MPLPGGICGPVRLSTREVLSVDKGCHLADQISWWVERVLLSSLRVEMLPSSCSPGLGLQYPLVDMGAGGIGPQPTQAQVEGQRIRKCPFTPSLTCLKL